MNILINTQCMWWNELSKYIIYIPITFSSIGGYYTSKFIYEVYNYIESDTTKLLK